MKRSVAIVGPTPMFVRWAILNPCQLRELYPQRLPESTFRQLRALREISLAAIEERIFDQVCIHPDASSRNAADALGILIDEISSLVGGLDFAHRCCENCPANAGGVSQPGLLAGCYGWIPGDLRFDFDRIIRGNQNEVLAATPQFQHHDLSELIEITIQQLDLPNHLAQHFPRWKPWWFGLWSREELTEAQLELLEIIFTHTIDQFDRALEREPTNTLSLPSTAKQDLIRFRDAIRACRSHGLQLHVELIPAGNSDGLRWTLLRHCAVCKRTTDPKATNCDVCGAVGYQQNEIKLKVLGIRPYLNLVSIFGLEATENLLKRFEST